MPEITELPKEAEISFIQNNPAIRSVYREAIPQSEVLNLPGFYRDLQLKITARIGNLRDAFPDQQENIDAFAQIMYGPLLLGGDALRNGLRKGVEDKPQKELSARIQHRYVHAIFASLGENVGDEYRKNLYLQLREMEKSSLTSIGIDLRIQSQLNGIKSELAICKTLAENDYRIIIPDYEASSDENSGNLSETREWDVDKGVDLIAVSPEGNIILIDAKGEKEEKDRNGNSIGEIRTSVKFRTEAIPVLTPDHSLQKKIQELHKETGRDKLSLKKVKIIVPTHETEMGSLGTREDSHSYKEALGRFGNLNSEHQQTILLTLGAL